MVKSVDCVTFIESRLVVRAVRYKKGMNERKTRAERQRLQFDALCSDAVYFFVCLVSCFVRLPFRCEREGGRGTRACVSMGSGVRAISSAQNNALLCQPATLSTDVRFSPALIHWPRPTPSFFSSHCEHVPLALLLALGV